MTGYNCTPAEKATGYVDKVESEKLAVIDPRKVPRIKSDFNVSIFGGQTVYQKSELTNLK